MSPTTYLLHGLKLSSELALDEPTVDHQPPDLWIRIGEAREIPDEIPEGEVVAELVLGGRRGYTVVETHEGLLVRFPLLADFLINHETQTIISHSAETTDPRFLSILLPGTVLAVYLSMLGRCVLHASAVEANGRAVVFAGISGMGKSTCAAMACAVGARLITDDLLVVELSDQPHAVPGASHVRLRQQASSILDVFPTRPHSWETVDGRVAVAPPGCPNLTQIAGVVIPRPSRDIERLEVQAITASQAMPRLLAFARVPGWKRTDVVRSQFMNTGALANRVRVFEAAIPWGPPFDVDPVRQLVEDVTHDRVP
ncbi:MAG TPA: hypothetical protein VJA46_14190 [Acidimicrobiia bacterium]|nr:hypothetical protein [Acidimicrobiia bacterium]